MNSPSPSDLFETKYLVGAIKIKTPGRKNAKQLLLLGTWLVFWLLVLVLILVIGYQVITGSYHEGEYLFSICMIAPLAFGLLIWCTRGVFAAYVFLWQIAGLETLEVSHNILKIRKTILGIGRTRVYEQNEITSIRLGTEMNMSFPFLKFKFAMFEVPITGAIAVSFANSRKTEYLGLGLEAKQAEKIVAIIQEQLFPRYA